MNTIRLIEPSEVAAYLKLGTVPTNMEAHIDGAHALVAAALHIPTLDARIITETHNLKYDTELIEVRNGPISELGAVTVNGTEMDLDDLIVGYWTIQNPDGWSKDDVVVLLHTAGWGPVEDNSASPSPEPPDGITQALIQATAQIYNTPNTDLVYEKIGDYTKQTAQGVPGRQEVNALDPRILILLRPFKKPSLSA